MAIFKKDEKIKGEKKDASINANDSKKSAVVKSATGFIAGKSVNVENILARPHITEKASVHAENNVYVFEVSKRANKTLVRNAVKELYKVTPEKINIINTPSKSVSSRGIKGVKSGKKKALVYLKKGDAIEII